MDFSFCTLFSVFKFGAFTRQKDGRTDGLTENAGHEFDKREIDGPSVEA